MTSGIEKTLLDGSPTNAPDDEPLPTISREHYKIDSELARGGMGRIFLARDRRLGRTVAVKEVLASADALLARFDREVRLTAILQHPGIVSIYEAGRWPSGEPFYAMRLIAGRPLEKVIAETTNLTERLALVPHVLAVAEALAYAHSQRIIHRDLKPGNVLVGTYGETVVIDWGLAKHLDEGATETTPYRDTDDHALTMLGSVMGTPSYMPIEQATGQLVDERVDVYAIGAILYETLCGKPPYEGPTGMSILDKLVGEPPVPLALRVDGVPADLLAIVERALARDAKDRYPTAKELADDLRRFQTGQLVASREYSKWELARRWLRKHRTMVAVVSIAVLVLLVIGATSYVRVVAARDRADDARLEAVQAAEKADQARAAEAKRSDELTIMQARTMAKSDPTAAIAWLAQLSPESTGYRNAAMIAADASSRGIAWLAPISAPVAVMAATKDRKKLLAFDREKSVWEIDGKTARVVGKLQGAPFVAAISDDASRAIANTGAGIELWSAAGSRVTKGQYPVAISGDGNRVAYLASEKSVAVCAFDGACQTIDVAAKELAFVGGSLVVTMEKDAAELAAWKATHPAYEANPAGEGRVTVFDISATPPAKRESYDKESSYGTQISADRQVVAFQAAGAIQHVTGAKVRSLPLKPCRFMTAISDDGRWFACNDVNVLRTFDSDGKPTSEVTLGDEVSRAAIGEGGLVAAAARTGELRLALANTKWQWSLVGHKGQIKSLTFLAGGKLASLGSDGAIRVWEVDAHARIASTLTPLEGLVTNRAKLAAGGAMAYTQERGLHAVIDDKLFDVALPKTGALPFILSISDDGSVVVFVESDGPAAATRAWLPRTGEVRALSGEVDPSSHWVRIYGTGAGRIALVRAGKLVVVDVKTEAVVWSAAFDLQTERAAFSHDLATGFIHGKRNAIRIATAAGERTVDVGVAPARLSVSRDGRWLGVIADTSAVQSRVCDLTAGTCRDAGTATFGGDGAMSANGRRFVMYGGQTITVFDTSTGKTETIARSNAVTNLAISADGELIAGIDAVADTNYATGGKVFVRDLASEEERLLPVTGKVEAVSIVDGATVRVLVEDAGFEKSPVVYTSVDALPRDRSLKGVLEKATNARIGPKGTLVAR